MDSPIETMQERATVQPCADFMFIVSPQEVETDGEQEFKATLISDPKSNVDLEVGLAARDADAACECTFDPIEVVLPAGKQATSTLYVRPRALLREHARKTYLLQAVATPSQSVTVPQKTEVRLIQTSARPLTLTVNPPTLTAELEADYAVVIANPSMRETSLFLSANDPEAGCLYEFQPAHIVVRPHANANVKLTVRPRESLHGKSSKMYRFRVEASSEREFIPPITAQGRFIQQPVTELTAEMEPPRQNRGGTGRYMLRISNPLPLAIVLSLEAGDEAKALDIKIKPPQLRVEAGAQAVAQLVVRPAVSLLPGERWRVHKFTVWGKNEGSETLVTAHGIFAQVPGIDWGTQFGSMLELISWMGRWALFFALFLFMATLSLGIVQEIACRNPRVGIVLAPLLNSSLIHLVTGLRLTLLSQTVVRLIADPIEALIGLAPRQCP